MNFGRQYARYVLVRQLLPIEAGLFGTYDIKLVGYDDGFELVNGRHEMVEEGDNSSFAEWLRLAEKRDELREVLRIMES